MMRLLYLGREVDGALCMDWQRRSFIGATNVLGRRTYPRGRRLEEI